MLKWIETTGRSEEDAMLRPCFSWAWTGDVSVEVIELGKPAFWDLAETPPRSG